MRDIIDNMRLAVRINAIQVISLLGLALVTLMVSLSGSRIAENSETLFVSSLSLNRQIDTFNLSIERARGMVSRVPAEFDLERQNEFKAVFDKDLGVARGALDHLRDKGSQERLAAIDQLAAHLDTMEIQAGEIFSLAANFAQDQANEILANQLFTLDELIDSNLEDLRGLADKETDLSLTSLRDIAWWMTVQALIVGLAVALVSLLSGWFVGRSITRPLAGMGKAMAALADAQLDIAIPGTGRGDEIGAMSRTVQVFKDNAIEMQRLQAEQTAADEQAKAARQRMLDELEEHVGSVVSSGVDGDLSRRVTASFNDPVLERLASGINRLVETVEQGLGENCSALAALARGDLTGQVEGNYRGAFQNLKDSTNATTEKLAEIVAQIQTATSEVENAAAEISSGTSDLSERTEQAASNL